MSFTKLSYHIVFSTKHRMPTIVLGEPHTLYRILHSIAKSKGAYVRRIGGMKEHVHILVDIPAELSVAEFVKTLKGQSSKALYASDEFPDWNGWSEGYGAFTVSYDNIQTVYNYIARQWEHHADINFIDEYRQWLLSNGISSDHPYFPKID